MALLPYSSRPLGEDVSEILEFVPGYFKVIRQVRPKLSCGGCSTIVQAPAPSRPVDRGLAGPGLLAHVLVSKFAYHLPLYRQAEIYTNLGVELERSTLADWVGGAARTLGKRDERVTLPESSRTASTMFLWRSRAPNGII